MSLKHALLAQLARNPETGYGLAKAFAGSLNYAWSASRSQIYPELSRLLEAGLIRQTESGPRGRKVYETTPSGLAELRGGCARRSRSASAATSGSCASSSCGSWSTRRRRPTCAARKGFSSWSSRSSRRSPRKTTLRRRPRGQPHLRSSMGCGGFTHAWAGWTGRSPRSRAGPLRPRSPSQRNEPGLQPSTSSRTGLSRSCGAPCAAPGKIASRLSAAGVGLVQLARLHGEAPLAVLLGGDEEAGRGQAPRSRERVEGPVRMRCADREHALNRHSQGGGRTDHRRASERGAAEHDARGVSRADKPHRADHVEVDPPVPGNQARLGRRAVRPACTGRPMELRSPPWPCASPGSGGRARCLPSGCGRRHSRAARPPQRARPGRQSDRPIMRTCAGRAALARPPSPSECPPSHTRGRTAW